MKPRPGARGRSAAALALAAAGAWWCSSCAPTGLADGTILSSVRVLASRADLPYAAPGQTVNLEVLAYDARPSQPAKMNVYWLPFVCDDPPNDAYYACFSHLGMGRQAGDGGAGGAPSALQPGVDLTPLLPSGPTYQITVPADSLTAHQATPGTTPYGIAIVFNIACAGHIELLPFDPANSSPQQVPIGCFDAQHNQLGPDDYVFGFTRVFAYTDRRNQNPVIDHIDIADAKNHYTPDPASASAKGFAIAHCTQDDPDTCPSIKIGPVVTPDSWELDPEDIGEDGAERHEQIWVDFFATFGKFKSGTRLLYDATSGLVVDTDTDFRAPQATGDGFIWMIVHDNRGGATWVTMPVHSCADGDPRCGG